MRSGKVRCFAIFYREKGCCDNILTVIGSDWPVYRALLTVRMLEIELSAWPWEIWVQDYGSISMGYEQAPRFLGSLPWPEVYEEAATNILEEKMNLYQAVILPAHTLPTASFTSVTQATT